MQHLFHSVAFRLAKMEAEMNQHTDLTHWALRQDLAAAFRWTVRFNMHEAVANHFCWR